MLYDNHTFAKMKIDIFYDFLKIDKFISKEVVEIGCGPAELAHIIESNHEINVKLIDILDQRIFLKKKNISLVDCSKNTIPLEDNSQDLVLCTQVLEHIPNISHIINEIYRILKPGGELICAFPNFSNIQQRLAFLKTGNVRRISGQINSGGHINLIPPFFFESFISPLFDLKERKGDYFASYNRIPPLLLSKGKGFIFKTSNTLLSYNIMYKFTKK